MRMFKYFKIIVIVYFNLYRQNNKEFLIIVFHLVTKMPIGNFREKGIYFGVYNIHRENGAVRQLLECHAIINKPRDRNFLICQTHHDTEQGTVVYSISRK